MILKKTTAAVFVMMASMGSASALTPEQNQARIQVVEGRVEANENSIKQIQKNRNEDFKLLQGLEKDVDHVFEIHNDLQNKFFNAFLQVPTNTEFNNLKNQVNAIQSLTPEQIDEAKTLIGNIQSLNLDDKVSKNDLEAAKTDLTTQINQKANQSALDLKADKTELAKKADKTELAKKANQTDVTKNTADIAKNTAALSAKADKADLSALDAKADQSVVAALQTQLKGKYNTEDAKQFSEGITASLQETDGKVAENTVALSKKADKTELDAKASKAELDNKADKTETAVLKTEVQTLNTRVDALQNQSSADMSARLDQLESAVANTQKDLERGLASQAALTGLFQPYNVGKVNISAALGGYGSSTAVAVGTGYRLDEKFAAKAGVSFNTKGGKASYNIGVNYEF